MKKYYVVVESDGESLNKRVAFISESIKKTKL